MLNSVFMQIHDIQFHRDNWDVLFTVKKKKTNTE